MAKSPRERFLTERDRLAALDDQVVRAALLEYCDAIDPEDNHSYLPAPATNGGVKRETKSNGTATMYCSALRCAHQRGLPLLEAEADTVNDFMNDLVTDPALRKHDLVEWDNSMTKPSAKLWQAALRSFYRYCSEPGATAGRPDVAVEWPADAIGMFTERSKPKHDAADMPEQEDLDAMREACLSSQNTRRDRAFLELAAGTGQRAYAIVTLRVGDVRLDGDIPHVLLNPEIDGDGDKGAIESTGRMKPIVTDVGPVRKWIEHHPFSDPDVREEHGAPERFEDCYLFVGALDHPNTDATDHFSADSASGMLERRKQDTASLSGVKTVEIPVNPHNWRHYAYTQSQELPIDESTRRKVFGWAPGSRTGQRTYGHKETEKAVREFVEAWDDGFGSGDAEQAVEEMVGAVASGDLPPGTRSDLVKGLASNDAFVKAVAEEFRSATE